jgi:hypothetical protein
MDRAREVAYAVIAHKTAKSVGAPYRQAWDDRIIDLKDNAQQLVARTDQLQTFMTAITVNALWEVYRDSTDDTERAEIVGMISDLCDVEWEDKYDPAEGWFYYGVDDSRDLNLFICRMYAIAWHKTGLTRHRDRFDEVFGHGVDMDHGGWVGGPHKQFNEQNLYLYDALRLRDAPVYTALDDTFEEEAPSPEVTSFAFTNEGSSSGLQGVSMGPLRIELGSGDLSEPVTFTFHVAGLSGSFSNPSRVLDDTTRFATTTFTPTSAGIGTISVTNNGDLPNPEPITYTSVSPDDPSNPPLVPILTDPGGQYPAVFVGGRLGFIIPWDGKP